MLRLMAFALFAMTIPAANWMIGNVGIQFDPNGPHMIPVGFGFYAPSGVLMVGLALVLRDAVHEGFGIVGALLAIVAGSMLSAFLSPPALVIASVAAFALAETADLMVYAPLRKRNLGAAVVASGIVGSVVDSAIFLWLAFGSMAFIEGQILGKVWMSITAFVLLTSWYRWKNPATI